MLMNAQQAAQIINSINDDRQKVVLDEICNVLDKRINNGKDFLWVPRKYMFPDFVEYFKLLGYEVVLYPEIRYFWQIDRYHYSYFMRDYEGDETAYLITVNSDKANSLKQKLNDYKTRKYKVIAGYIALLICLVMMEINILFIVVSTTFALCALIDDVGGIDVEN